ncbi:hypothetical protein R5R35_014464 [Gryllus longicercus]|uniref:Uncharacterized protein n=1 Tax=Gryllus longicercus TaxID=2509291 RepID=A0AAN9YXK4_9ORTH
MNCFTLLTLVLLAGAAGADLIHDMVVLRKCCDAYQMLSADGESCEDADWPRNFSIKIQNIVITKQHEINEVLPPLDSEWVRRWLPPGPAMNVRFVQLRLNQRFVFNAVISVNSTSFFNPLLHRDEELWRSSAAFIPDTRFVARPKPGGGYREASYCIDAAPRPLGPFVMKFRTKCNKEECANKCCSDRAVMQDDKGHWGCGQVRPDFWKPHKSSLAAFDSEFPYEKGYGLCESPRLLPFDERYANWFRHFHFSTSHTCVDFFRSGNASLKEGLFQCKYPLIAVGVYRLVRPLCVLSALLLTASLLTVACDKTMRRNAHGRCLATHAACLLAFNVGQIWYYLALSDRRDEENKQVMPPDLQIVCKSIGEYIHIFY